MAVRSKKSAPSKSGSHYHEVIGITFFALAILIFLCLFSFDPNDWNLSTSSSQPTRNWIGPVGSVIADLFFQTIGSMAHSIPVLLVIIGIRYITSGTARTKLSRVIGILLFLFSGAALLTLFGFYGGLTGALLVSFTESLMNPIGAGIVFFALLFTSGILVTSFSYKSVFESIHLAWTNFRIRFAEWKEPPSTGSEAKATTPAKKTAPASPDSEQTPAAQPTISTGTPQMLDTGEPAPAGIEDIGAKVSEVFRRIEDPFGETAGPSESDAGEGVEKKAIAATAGAGDAPDIVPEMASVSGAEGESAEDSEEENRKEFDPENYDLPKIEFLTKPPPRVEQNDEELIETAKDLTQKSEEFNVTGQVKHIGLGPVVTTYEFKPDPGVKYSRVTGLADDLCLALRAESIRIERIPGKAHVGIEVPNKERETIFLRDVIESDAFQDSKSLLTVGLGKKIDGARQIADLSRMPHLLIAGATGSGKSVGVNSLIVSILYKARPDQVKFIMVDPKRLELGVYSDIPHLATPIITDPKRAAISLKWAVSEMERRYKELAGWGVRNIDGFNSEVERRNKLGRLDDDGNPHETLPYIVIIIDELADLMMISGKEVEESITRLAQMARAVGIHLVLATQRPSVDVITGLIKANFPARIAFRVSSKIDSRTIIDANGAERLLGKGDMLFLPPATSQIVRVHGAYVDEKEIRRVVDYIKEQAAPEYDESITRSEEEEDEFGDLPGRGDKLFPEALRTVVGAKRASTSLLQRHLRIGYGRAAAILDALVAEGYIGEMDGSKRARPILQKAYEALQEMEEGREL